MTCLKFILTAKTQYNIQSPFLFELYSEVISPTLDKALLNQLNINPRDRIAQLQYKLHNHYNIQPIEWSAYSSLADIPDTQAALPAENNIILFPFPHKFVFFVYKSVCVLCIHSIAIFFGFYIYVISLYFHFFEEPPYSFP